MSALLKGFLSENAVAHELIARNFEIYKPVIDIYGSDFVICKNNMFYKVQVKSASQLDNTKYAFNMQYGTDKKTYESDMVDFFILHLADINLFYIIPFNDMNVTKITLSTNELCKYNQYKEAWSLLEE